MCADTPPLLQSAFSTWTAQRTDWAFIRRTRTVNSKGVTTDERVESYDPSQPDSRRWRLLEVDGRPPTPKQLEAEDAKNRKPRRFGGEPPASLLELSHATLVSETPTAAVYDVPVRPIARSLAQTDKLVVLVTVDRQTGMVERLNAQLHGGPMRLALGLAKVTDFDLDLSFDPTDTNPLAEAAPTGGTARATLSAFGEHREYEWTDFRSVHARS
jgi:hypothetical protein